MPPVAFLVIFQSMLGVGLFLHIVLKQQIDSKHIFWKQVYQKVPAFYLDFDKGPSFLVLFFSLALNLLLSSC